MQRGKRLVLDADGNDVARAKLGYRWLLASSAPTRRSAALVASTKKQLDSGFLDAIAGNGVWRRARTQGTFAARVSGRTTVIIVSTARTLKLPIPFVGVALVLHPDENMLAGIDAQVAVGDLLVVPSNSQQAQKWIDCFDFQRLWAEVDRREETLLTIALRGYSEMVNASNGLTSSDNREVLRETLFLLLNEGESLDPVAVQRTLAEEGWEYRDAIEARKYTERLAAARYPRRPKYQTWPDDIVERWRDKLPTDVRLDKGTGDAE